MKSTEDINDKNEEKPQDSKKDGQGQHKSAKAGVHLSEEFQQRVHELTHQATDHECSHLHKCAGDREEVLRSEKNNKGKSTGASTPATYSDSDMPQD